jgi:hypothetical protein
VFLLYKNKIENFTDFDFKNNMNENKKSEYFEDIYKDWWEPQVELGNIPKRTFETRCRCHPDIVNDIMFNDLLLSLDQSYSYNKPKIYCIHYNPVEWIIDKLQDIYEDTIFGYQCYQDVSNIHSIFWKKLNKKERQEVRDYISTEPCIVENGDVIFNWKGGWSDFSLVMCAVYQKSFDHIEIN